MFIDASCDLERETGQRDSEQLDRARELLRKSMAEVRTIVGELRPPQVHEQGLVGAIEDLIGGMKLLGLEVVFEHEGVVGRAEPAIEATIVRIVREALTNAQRHSGSTTATVRLRQSERLRPGADRRPGHWV